MTTIYLIRHCETESNIASVFQGHSDSPPTENGLRQLDALARRFRDIPLDGIYSSPLGRAVATARSLTKYHDLPVVTDKRLMEINGGDFEGIKWETLDQRFPEHMRRWREEPWNFKAPNGEPTREVYERMRDALTDIAKNNEGKTVAVVSHGDALKNALCFLKGHPVDEMLLCGVFVCLNTAVTTVEATDGAFRIISEADASHLDALTL